MADAPTPEQRRRVARLSAHEAAVATPSLLIQVKRLVAEVDALTPQERASIAAALGQDWGRLFRGCRADFNRGRYSIYRRTRAQLEALRTALDAMLSPIQLVGHTISQAAATDTFSMNLPPSRQVGDLLVYAAFKNGSVTGITQTAGWSLPNPGSPGGTSGGVGAAARYRVLLGGEPDTIQLQTAGSAGNWVGIMWQVRGFSGVPNAAGEGNPSAGPVSTPTLTFEGALWLVAAGAASGAPTGAPAGFGGLVTAGAGPVLMAARRKINGASQAAGAFTTDNANFRSMTIGIASE